jgi:peptidoglycan hydrolase-like protein with peptidoglycan-binding domain
MTKSLAALIGVLGVTAMLSVVVLPSAEANSNRQSAAAHSTAAARCLTWRRSSPTKAYHKGRTAGYSWAWNKTVGVGGPGGSTTRINRVKEIQCLLDYRGFDDFLQMPTPPPMEDWQPWGYYGVYTSQNVSQAQSMCRIPVDGVVGPATWRCLRRDKHW